jgi:hypothetical protein
MFHILQNKDYAACDVSRPPQGRTKQETLGATFHSVTEPYFMFALMLTWYKFWLSARAAKQPLNSTNTQVKVEVGIRQTKTYGLVMLVGYICENNYLGMLQVFRKQQLRDYGCFQCCFSTRRHSPPPPHFCHQVPPRLPWREGSQRRKMNCGREFCLVGGTRGKAMASCP